MDISIRFIIVNVLYSGKLLREKIFTNLAILQPPVKVFSMKCSLPTPIRESFPLFSMCTCLTWWIYYNIIYYHMHIIIDMCTVQQFHWDCQSAHLVNMFLECVVESVFFYVVYAISPLHAREKCTVHIHVDHVVSVKLKWRALSSTRHNYTSQP